MEPVGSWTFASREDGHRASRLGYVTPEEILVAQDRGDGSYDEIAIEWIPGDATLHKPLVASAAQHLQNIYGLRCLLGLPMSLQGEIPVYSPEGVRLEQFWDMLGAAEGKEQSGQEGSPVDFDRVHANLPCMDCGLYEDHKPDCHIRDILQVGWDFRNGNGV